MRCWSISGKSADSGALNDVLSDASVVGPSVTPDVTYQTSMKFSKDPAARDHDIVSPASIFWTYTQLLEYIVSADLVLYMLMVGAVIVMRRKAPEIERPYRTFGYPIVPVIYLVIAGLFIIDLAILAPSTSGIGYLLVATGVPIYYVWRKRI